jgi:hypothetical protein
MGSRRNEYKKWAIAHSHGQKAIRRVELKAIKCCIQGRQDIGIDLELSDGSLIADVCLVEVKAPSDAFDNEHEMQAQAQALCSALQRHSGGLDPVDDAGNCITDEAVYTRLRRNVKAVNYKPLCSVDAGMSESSYEGDGEGMS